MRDDYVATAIRLGGALEPVDRVEDVVIARPNGAPGLAARAYRPAAVEPVGVLLWLHGGGWCIGDLDGFDRVCRALCNAAGATVVSVDYRLGPERPYPAGVGGRRPAGARPPLPGGRRGRRPRGRVGRRARRRAARVRSGPRGGRRRQRGRQP